MPTIEIDRKELNELVGREIPRAKLEAFLPDIKCEVEDIDDLEAKVEVTFDRIDLFSVEGIARALRNYLEIEREDYAVEEPDMEMKVAKVKARPHIAAGVVRGVTLDKKAVKSLMQLQEKLHESYGRDRKRVAIGLHDLDKVEPPFSYSGVIPEEASFVPLGRNKEMNLRQILMNHEKGKKYSHILEDEEKFPVIVDSNGDILSFPPIINSKKTEITEETKNVFIDVTGTDEESVHNALKIVAAALSDRGGKVHGVSLDFNGEGRVTPEFESKARVIDIDEMEDIIGTSLEEDTVGKYLRKMGYKVNVSDGGLEAEIPFYRTDILHDVDIAEDLAMGIGYNEIEPELPNLLTHGEEEELERTISNVRDLMIGLGYQEVLNTVLTSEEKSLDMMRRKGDIIRLENPLSENYSVTRDLLSPGILDFLSKNTHKAYPQKVFEVGEIVVPDEERAEKTRCDRKLAGVSAGTTSNYTQVRGELEGALRSLDLPEGFEFKKSSKDFFIKGRCAKIIYKGKDIGFIGEIHPECLNNFEIEVPVTLFEINLEFIKEI